jgi:hypothetical protein
VTPSKIAGVATAVVVWAGLTLAFLATTNTTCTTQRSGGHDLSGIASRLCATGSMPSPLLLVVAAFVLIAILWRPDEGVALRPLGRAFAISLIVYLGLYAVSVHVLRGH